MNPIDEFVSSLSKKRNTSIISNPYLDPALANNLSVYLKAIYQESNKPVLLVGEALGFKGGKLTGIPFSRRVRKSDFSLMRCDTVYSGHKRTITFSSMFAFGAILDSYW